MLFFGKLSGNVVFDGPGQDEDFGLEQLTGLLAPDLVWRRGPSAEPLKKLDGALRRITLDDSEFEDLHAFVANGLLDPRARSLSAQIPAAAPSGANLHAFPECQQ